MSLWRSSKRPPGPSQKTTLSSTASPANTSRFGRTRINFLFYSHDSNMNTNKHTRLERFCYLAYTYMVIIPIFVICLTLAYSKFLS